MNNRYDTIFKGQRIYLPGANAQKNSFSLVAGHSTLNLSVHETLVSMEDCRDLDLEMLGIGDEDTTYDCRIWAVSLPSQQFPRITPSGGRLNLFATLTCTLGVTAGVGPIFTNHNAITGQTLLVVDDIQITMADWGTSILNAYQLEAPAPYNLGSNYPSSIRLPLFGRFANAFILEFDRTGATGCNALYSLVDN